MKLVYRGTTYDRDPTAKARRLAQQTSGSAYDLIYRGSTYRFDPTMAQLANRKPISYQLIYRGSIYQANRKECSLNTFDLQILMTNSLMPHADKH
jgi:hypothetical protein